METGHSLDDAKDALVELELIGFRFYIDDGFRYDGTETENLNGRLIEIPKDYMHRRLELVREFREEIIEWLRSRTLAEIVNCLERVSDRIQARANAMQNQADEMQARADVFWRRADGLQRQTDSYQQEAQKLWDHWTKAVTTFWTLEAAVGKADQTHPMDVETA